MRKILWLCNTMLPELFDRFKIFNVKEGWLVGISEELRKQDDIELHYMCPQKKEKRIVNLERNSIHFHCFYAKYMNAYTIEESIRTQIERIISDVQPEIIHIFGTEMPHTIACIDCIKRRENVVISIQGLVSEYAKYYLDGIPGHVYLKGGFYRGKYQTIFSQYKEFCRRTDNEIKAIKSVRHIIGRTDWDRACVHRINSKCEYHYCSETLRDCFYGKEWQINQIERYTIFVSQGDYPIKGLHNLLAALPAVIKEYPGTKVYVAGSDAFLNDGSPYGVYINNLIEKKKLRPYIIFAGLLDGNRMCQRLLKSHVTVMPSNIENSPNSVGEAMLVGTPVIASFVGGIPNILQHGTEGILYQSDTPQMLSHYICKIFEDDCFVGELSLNARKRAQQLYNRGDNLRQLLGIYDKILS